MSYRLLLETIIKNNGECLGLYCFDCNEHIKELKNDKEDLLNFVRKEIIDLYGEEELFKILL